MFCIFKVWCKPVYFTSNTRRKTQDRVGLCFKITHPCSIYQFKRTDQQEHSILAPSFRFSSLLSWQSFFFISHNASPHFPPACWIQSHCTAHSRLQMTSYSLKNKHRGTEKKKKHSPQPKGSTGRPIPLRKTAAAPESQYGGNAGDEGKWGQ